MSERRIIAKRAYSLFGIAMAAIYTLAGIFLIFDWTPLKLPGLNRITIGVVLILYSGFRWYKISRPVVDTDQSQKQ